MVDLPGLDGPDDPWIRATSPDGAFVWLIDANEYGPSQWVMSGQLWRKSPVAELFSVPRDWSLEGAEWSAENVVQFQARRHPGRMPGIHLTLDAKRSERLIVLDTRPWKLEHSPVPPEPVGPQSFAALTAWLEAYPKA